MDKITGWNSLKFRCVRKLDQWQMLVKYLAALSLKGILCRTKEYKNLWIIAERGVDARDNAYWLFCYIRRTRPDINIRYIISRDSADRDRVAGVGALIEYRSFKHYLAIAASEVKISSHIMGYTPGTYYFTRIEKMGLIRGTKIFLQHGIIKDDMPFLHYESTQPDLFVCGAGKEAEYIRSAYGHPEGVVRHLGLCRYDRLSVEPDRKLSRTILIMPTWRLYYEPFNEEQFRASSYYHAYQSLFESREFQVVLEEYDYSAVFYPHHELQRFLHCFETQGPRIRVASLRDEDVQQLLIRADVLVTDYSSVFFDFAYMGKPIVYYQFDREEYRAGHYGEGYFQYERDGFGKVTYICEDLLERLKEILAAGTCNEALYAGRAGEFFLLRDQDNCRRNLEAIEEIAEAKKQRK